MSRPSLSTARVTDAAVIVVDRHGFAALNVSVVAGELGVKPSALYNHVDGAVGLHYLIAVRSTVNLAHDVREAAIGVGGDRALDAIGTAYRRFAHTKPGQFAYTFLPPVTADDELARANGSVVGVFVLVYRAMGLKDSESDLAARSTRSAIHGFCALEQAAGPATRQDAEYRHLLDTLRRGIREPRTN
ncbi:TetR-like C-terminal domain-containing protein [soil metagenome]